MSEHASNLPRISRRRFLATSGGLTFAIALGGVGGPLAAGLRDGHAAADPGAIGAWVRIDVDGIVTIFNPAAEMGQGSMTALPVIVAEEMDADWSMVRIEQAPVEPALYGNPSRFGGRMLTVGSRTVQGYYTALRKAGAGVRRVLVESAAREWQVPVGELVTEPGVVVHPASGRRLGYGELAAITRAPERLPEVSEAELKPRSAFRLIGKNVPRADVPDKVNGKAVYGIDVKVPGMLYAVISRAPVNGSRPRESNAAAIRERRGVVDVVALDHGVAVVAESMEAALAARAALDITWSEGARARGFQSETALAGYRDIARDPAANGSGVHRSGAVDAALGGAAQVFTAEYLSDHAYHAQMEPLNAVADVSPAGDAAEVWAGTQFQDGARDAAARALGIAAERVTFHPCYLGGGYGRRSLHENVEEAVLVSRAVGRPVKVIWSREDDVRYGAFRPMALQRLEAGLDAEGRLTAWRHVVVGEGGSLLTSGIRIPYYDIPNQDIEVRATSHGVRLKHWRAVGHGFNKLAIEGFIDEIAAARGADPYAFRRTLMRGSPRAQRVLDAAAEMAGWGSPRPAGRALGIAFAERSDSLGAGVAEVSLDRASGRIRVHRFWAALDAGVVVQPDNAVAQMESGIMWGLSSIIAERITFADGAVEQSNFHDYPVLRMADAPESVEVRLIDSDEPPTGIGESGVPLVPAAVANAVAALTGARLRHMPFTPARVKAALGA